MTTIKLYGGDLGGETMLVRCDLTLAASPVEVNYQTGPESGWQGTQYQCADAGHRIETLVDIAKGLASTAVEMPSYEFECEWETVD